MKYLFLLLISFNLLADEFSVGFGTGIVKQELRFSPDIEFNMPTSYIDMQYWSDYYMGGRVAVFRSTETQDEFDHEGKKWTNKINYGYQLEVGVKFDVTDKSSVFTTIGLTEYNTDWWQDGVKPEWSGGSDSFKPSVTVGYKYKFTDKLNAKLFYSYMYYKNKAGYGKEVTQYYAVGLEYLL